MENMENAKSFSSRIASIKAELAKDVVGNEEVIENIIIAIISGGNVLLEGVPGVGKTRLVRSLSRTLGLPFSRIQLIRFLKSLCMIVVCRSCHPSFLEKNLKIMFLP